MFLLWIMNNQPLLFNAQKNWNVIAKPLKSMYDNTL